MMKVQIFIPAIASDTSGFIDLDLTLTRAQADQMSMDLIQKTFKVCDEALMMARLSPGDLDGIILVGGATRMPIVYNSGKTLFPKRASSWRKPRRGCWCLGAAIQGAELLKDSQDLVFAGSYASFNGY